MEYLADNISSGDDFTFIIIVSDIIFRSIPEQPWI